VEPRILHEKQLIILAAEAGAAVTMGLPRSNIQKPDNAAGQQKDDEHGELFFCS